MVFKNGTKWNFSVILQGKSQKKVLSRACLAPKIVFFFTKFILVYQHLKECYYVVEKFVKKMTSVFLQLPVYHYGTIYDLLSNGSLEIWISFPVITTYKNQLSKRW